MGKHFFAGEYQLAVVDMNTGEQKPLAGISPVKLAAPEPREPFKPISLSDMDSFEMTFTANAETDEWFASLFKEPDWDGVYHLGEDGKVYAYVRFSDKDGNELAPPRWWYVDVIDRGVWRYALHNGLQLEDAVRELNAKWAKAAH